MQINQVHLGKCLEVMKTFPDNFFHSIVTDSPYGLSFMNKHWDYDVPGIDVWQEVLRVLRPGGFLLSFSGTRTYHRMVVNIEDAGFEIRDQIQWIYGSGFPKSLDVSKAIDCLAGVQRNVIGQKETGADSKVGKGTLELSKKTFKDDNGKTVYNITEPATEEAKEWDGWGTALKPANEPICVARKPLEGTVAENILKWGTGGINIDDCRIEFVSEEDKKSAVFGRGTGIIGGNYVGAIHGNGKTNIEPNGKGRFPANIILDESAAEMLDEQTGTLKSGAIQASDKPMQNSVYGKFQFGNVSDYDSSEGGASRFFYVAKASQEERNGGLKNLAKKKLDEARKDGNPGGDNPRFRGLIERANHHPTVKPIDLMRYLVRLVTPKNGVTLDPYCGSGSTLIAAMLEKLNYVGIDQEPEYIAITEARLKYWHRFVDRQGKLFE